MGPDVEDVMDFPKLDGGLSALTDVLGDDFDNAEERYLLETLAILRESHEKMIKPYIDRLVSIRSMRPTAPMLVTRKQAEALGLLPPNCNLGDKLPKTPVMAMLLDIQSKYK